MPHRYPTPHSRVAVAMSGGVDSSVAALLLHRAGWDSIGISMQVWDYKQNGGCSTRATCCAPEDFTDARKVAAKVGIPYYVFDLERTFRDEVINKFVRSYEQGLTPNPCVDCNSRVKFRELRERAKTMECTHVATGHYARIEHREDGYHLLRGKDSRKDQSYFLYGLTQPELGSTLFPLGDMTKDEAREEARQAGLAVASKPESQDICFVGGTVSEFLERHGAEKSAGRIVNRRGEELGRHDGIRNFTVGQRRGLKIGGTEQPMYVLELDPVTNNVIVGEKMDLERSQFMVTDVALVAPSLLSERGGMAGPLQFEARAQLRHRHRGVSVSVTLFDDNRAEVKFSDEWSPVSPGQAAVFYSLDDQEVLGGGRIELESSRLPIIGQFQSPGVTSHA